MPLYTQREKYIFCNFQLTCSSFYRLRHISSGVISTFSGTLVHNGVYKKNFIKLALSLEWTIFTAEEMFLLLYHWDFYESFTILPTIFWICKQLNKLNLKLTLMLDDETLTKIAEKSVFFYFSLVFKFKVKPIGSLKRSLNVRKLDAPERIGSLHRCLWNQLFMHMRGPENQIDFPTWSAGCPCNQKPALRDTAQISDGLSQIISKSPPCFRLWPFFPIRLPILGLVQAEEQNV